LPTLGEDPGELETHRYDLISGCNFGMCWFLLGCSSLLRDTFLLLNTFSQCFGKPDDNLTNCVRLFELISSSLKSSSEDCFRLEPRVEDFVVWELDASTDFGNAANIPALDFVPFATGTGVGRISYSDVSFGH
jgi:hypothetical protein